MKDRKYLRFRMKKINLGIFVVIVNECHKVFIFGMRYNKSNALHITMDQIETTFSTTTVRRKRKRLTLT